MKRGSSAQGSASKSRQPPPARSGGVVESGPLGLTYGTVELAETDPAWEATYRRLADSLSRALSSHAPTIEHIGSTAVHGLPAKPILDIAVGLSENVPVDELSAALTPLGYIFRGDKGEEGGLLFVLEDRPWHRVAAVHAVAHRGAQWNQYLAFRELLRRDASVRESYAQLKRSLARDFPNDRRAYTAAKHSFIREHLSRL